MAWRVASWPRNFFRNKKAVRLWRNNEELVSRRDACLLPHFLFRKISLGRWRNNEALKLKTRPAYWREGPASFIIPSEKIRTFFSWRNNHALDFCLKEQGGMLDYFLRGPGIATSSLIRILIFSHGSNDALDPSLIFFAEEVATPGLLRDAGCLPHYFFR